MNTLGIYFGPDIISIVETKGKKIIHNIQLPQKDISPGELEEKVPSEIKMVAFFKDELRKNNIIAEQANLALSGKDLIIRTFEMPLMPRDDLASAINFEAKKYIPFKAEELILDYQLYYDKAIRKNLVLLVGIKKETLDKYLSIFAQLNLKIISLDYAAFSVLRVLKLAGLRDKGIVGLIAVDPIEIDEVNFMVLENGFPLFSRDITLKGGPQESIMTEEIEPGVILEKLKTEIRISLEYYQRKFPTKKIDKIFLISSRDYQSDLEVFVKDIGLHIQSINVDKYIGKPAPFSLSLIKSYSSSLSKAIKIKPQIDLLLAKTRQARKMATPSGAAASVLKGLRIEPAILILALSMLIMVFIFGFYQKLPLQKKLKEIQNARPRVSTVNPEASYEELTSMDSKYKRKLNNLDNLIKKQLYATFPLNIIPEAIPKGVWLRHFSFNDKGEGKTELFLEGMAYLADSDKEFEMLNNFLLNLKGNIEFTKYFKEINIISIARAEFKTLPVTNFSISCKTYKGKE